MLHSICQVWKTQQWPWDWKTLVFISIPKKGNDKECSNCCTIVLISPAIQVMLKILQVSLQRYMNQELPHVRAGLIKERGTRDQAANIHWIIEKAKEFQKKTSIFASLSMLKLLTVWIKTNCENSSRDGNTRSTDLPPEKPVCRSRSNSENQTWKNGLVQNWERSMSRLYIVTLLI